jgi:hypothetical protein
VFFTPQRFDTAKNRTRHQSYDENKQIWYWTPTRLGNERMVVTLPEKGKKTLQG